MYALILERNPKSARLNSRAVGAKIRNNQELGNRKSMKKSGKSKKIWLKLRKLEVSRNNEAKNRMNQAKRRKVEKESRKQEIKEAKSRKEENENGTRRK